MGSLGLMVAKAVQMGTGFLFWVVAARAADVSQVGVVSAAVAGVMLCTQLGTLGSGSAVISWVGRGSDPRTVLEGAITILVVFSTVCAVGYLGITALTRSEVGEASRSPLFVAVFVVAAIAGAGQILLDQAGVALRRPATSISRYTAGGILAVLAAGAVVLFTGRSSSLVLFGAWTVGAVAVCLVGQLQLRRLVGAPIRPRLRSGSSRHLLGVGMPNQVLTLTERVPAQLVPVLVAHVVSARSAALWYPAWMMAWTAYSAPVLVGITQFAEGVRRTASARDTLRAGIRWSLLVGGLTAAALCIGAGPVLGLLGPEYAHESANALRLLALGVVPFSIVQAYNAQCRSRHTFSQPIALGVIQSVALCSTAVLAARHGTTAMAAAWLTCSTLAGAWAGVRLLKGDHDD